MSAPRFILWRRHRRGAQKVHAFHMTMDGPVKLCPRADFEHSDQAAPPTVESLSVCSFCWAAVKAKVWRPCAT